MAHFCNRCGNPLVDGKCPSCDAKETSTHILDSAKSHIESMKNHMGISSPDPNNDDVYEENLQIVPDCVKASEGEMHVKQYKLAKLKSRAFGIPYAKAVGRMQITNKRVIFRASGKSLVGKTTLQHEFTIDEIAGIEARKEHSFNIWDLIIGFIVAILGGAIVAASINAMSELLCEDNHVSRLVLAYLFCLSGGAPFFILKKKWLLKLLCLGGSFIPLILFGYLTPMMVYTEGKGLEFFSKLAIFMGIGTFILTLITLFIYAIKPNLVLVIKTKSASEAIDIQRKRNGFAAMGKDAEHTGFTEVIPEEDAENCIREINAMITDIQKLGDFGIEKWKA